MSIFSFVSKSSCFAIFAFAHSALGAAAPNPAVPQNLGGFDALLPYVIPSPHQEDAGSCLYMATTGIAEWWMAKLHPHVSRASGGPLDFSERYLMNIGAGPQGEASLKNWLTDSMLIFNKNGSKGSLNRDYPYTKGWHIEGNEFNEPATADTPNAVYGTGVNWISELENLNPPTVEMPIFKREIIFAAPSKNPWSVGEAPRGIWKRGRQALITQKAPVLVIYNHHMVWHTVVIVGFHDTMANGNCAFTRSSQEFFAKEIVKLKNDVKKAQTRDAKDAAKAELQNAEETSQKLNESFVAGGGCSSSQGVFYVRDSWEPNPEGPLYDYDSTTKGEEGPFSNAVVFREFDWLDHFASSVVLVTVKPSP